MKIDYKENEKKEILKKECKKIIHNFTWFERIMVHTFYFFLIHKWEFIDYHKIFSYTNTGKKFFKIVREIDLVNISAEDKKRLLQKIYRKDSGKK